ncbi:asparagine synthetase B [Tistrella bauzanensis]|uniref:asparagine synthase (glutamine-hydrolyzing) n=1 Tax=Tistrella bauzanensis TaxID=657419 RepID=A0ABQ1IS56_9PROT|nr:asparagine synthetase B [Tistrella bauzanensis]GGB49848.1 asparagine synthetase B [Tistrella bauzanensis]
MTALAGYWQVDGNTDGDDACHRMLSAQAMYAPGVADSDWGDDQATLGIRLNRLLSEDAHDRQPLEGAGGRFTLIADLRLDNREDLARALDITADRLRVLSDADVLLAAFERWDVECVHRLRGAFAIVVWDAVNRRLVLARDPLGQRPLHYHRGRRNGRGFFAVASMPKGLLALPDMVQAPDMTRMTGFVALLPENGTASFFEGVERVECGHVVVVTADGLTARRYWNPAPEMLKLPSHEAYAEGLRHHLDRATAACLRGAGGSVTSHLSSGFDSAAVTATAARQMAARNGRVTAYTSVPRPGFQGKVARGRYADEGPLAASVAALYPNINHVLVPSIGTSPLKRIDFGFQFCDRPILNPCNHVWMNRINDLAQAAGDRILLSGQMGNMGLSYNGDTLYQELLSQRRYLTLFREMRASVRRGRWRWRGALFNTIGPMMPRSAWQGLRRLARQEVALDHVTLINPARIGMAEEMARGADFDLGYRPWTDGVAMRMMVLRRVDGGNFYKGVLAAWGLDSRDPTSDVDLLEYCLSVPTEQFQRNGVARRLARTALADRLPAPLLDEDRRGYQAADWYEAVKADAGGIADMAEAIKRTPLAREVLDVDRLDRLVAALPTTDLATARGAVESYRLSLLRGAAVGDFVRRASRVN